MAKKKLYCPWSMVRYDGGVNGYETMWVCKICLACCLTQNYAKQHSSECRKKFALSKVKTPVVDPLLLYTCSVCGSVFNRHVKLKKHIEIHNNVKINAVVTEKMLIKKKTTEKQTGNVVVRTEEGLTKHVIKTKLIMAKKNPSMNCKLQKKITKKIIKPDKPNCPSAMVVLSKVKAPGLDPLDTIVYTCSLCGHTFNRQVKLKQHTKMHGNIKINTTVTQKMFIKKKTTEKQNGNVVVRTEKGLTKHVKIETKYVSNY